VRLTHH